MFILRQVARNGRIYNQSIGESYSIIRSNNENFPIYMELDSNDEAPDAYLIYTKLGGEQFWPLYPKFEYFIMNQDGGTFERIYLNHPPLSPCVFIKTDGGYVVEGFYEYQDGDKRNNKDAFYVGDFEELNLTNVEWSKEGELLSEGGIPKDKKLADFNIFQHLGRQA